MKLQYYIKGMDCAEEVALLKRELVPLVGEESIAFDLLNAKLTVTTNDSKIGQREIVEAIARSGLKAVRWSAKSETTVDSYWTSHQSHSVRGSKSPNDSDGLPH